MAASTSSSPMRQAGTMLEAVIATSMSAKAAA
jgi:hypothetical protein